MCVGSTTWRGWRCLVGEEVLRGLGLDCRYVLEEIKIGGHTCCTLTLTLTRVGISFDFFVVCTKERKCMGRVGEIYLGFLCCMEV